MRERACQLKVGNRQGAAAIVACHKRALDSPRKRGAPNDGALVGAEPYATHTSAARVTGSERNRDA